jgi:flavin-binding protein dodecin
MNALVRAALAETTRSVRAIPWDELDESRKTGTCPAVTHQKITDAIARAVNCVDALKSSLRSLW